MMKKNKILLTSIIASLLFHFGSMVVVWFRAHPMRLNESKNVEVTFVDKNELKEQTKKENATRGQIVEQDKTINDEIPNDAKYLSQFNQKVKKETRALLNGKFQNAGGLGPSSKTNRMNPKETSKSASKNKEEPSRKMVLDKMPSGLPTLSVLTPQYQWKKKDLSEDATKPAENSESGGNGTQVSQDNDYTKDTEKGVQTILNTREFVYYSYYARIKNQLNQYWEPKIKDKVMNIFRQGRRIASEHDRITKLLIILNEKGTLVGVKVLGQSGEEDLDNAAIEAFQQAAPFPNPPHGIVEKDGTIKIRWDFVIEV